MKNAKCRKKMLSEKLSRHKPAQQNSFTKKQHVNTKSQKLRQSLRKPAIRGMRTFRTFTLPQTVQKQQLKICCPKANSFAGSNQTLTRTALKSLSRHKEKTCSVTQKKTFSHKTQHFGATKKPTGLPSVFCFCEVTSIRQST